MKKVAKDMEVVIARFGGEPKKVKAVKGATVGEFLQDENITLNTGEKVWVNGEAASMKDELENGDVLNIVASKSGGR